MSQAVFAPDPHGYSWPLCRDWIQDACERCDGWWTIEAVEDLLSEGKVLLWVLSQNESPVAAVVTAVCDWDGRRVAEVMLTGGENILAEAREHFWKIDDWARQNGAREVLIRGRRGWAKALKSHGYDEISVTLRKVL